MLYIAEGGGKKPRILSLVLKCRVSLDKQSVKGN
jgi:hypothetical protein